MNVCFKRLTAHSSYYMHTTVLQANVYGGGTNTRGPSTGSQWATTYDDTYTKVQATHGVVAHHMQDAFPHRF